MGYYEGLGSIRTKKAPKKTIKAYKLMRLVDGKLYPLFIDSSVPTEIGVWYDADSTSLDSLIDKEAGFYYLMSNEGDVIRKQAKKPTKTEVEDVTKMGLRYMYVKQAESKQRRYGGYKQYYNVGINGSGVVSPTYAIRPGWHAGSLPTMRQIGKGSNKDKRDDSFVWTEVELSADVDYNPEAQRNPDKDIPDHIPEDGYYMKATNADKKKSQADLVGWYVAGAMKINRIISDKEARQIIDRFNAKHPGKKKVEYDYDRESGKEFDAGKMRLEGISSVLSGLGMSVHHNSPYLLKRADGSFIDPETGERLGFDHRFMSSGEGHQAHGWGSYFSVEDLKKYGENKSVKKDVYYVKYKGILYSDKDKVGEKYVIAYDLIQKEGTTSKAKSEAKRFKDKAVDNEVESFWDDVIGILSNSKKSDFKKAEGGHHYHVEIPDNDGIIYLEEEDPLKEEQIEKIKSQAKKENKKDIVTMMSYAESHPYEFSLFRSDIVNHSNSRDNMTPEEFSKFLSRAGFVGIHYYGNLDGECYVIFDENDAKIVGHDLFGVEDKKLTPSQQYQNRRQARASQLKKGDNITYTEDDFFRVECDDLKRAHEAIMYWNEKLPKKSIAWLDDLLLDDKGYPIYTVLEQAESFIESYNLYKDEWKRDFIFADSSSDNEVRLWMMNNRIGRADENLYKEITKVHHKPSLLLIYEWIKKSIIRRDDDAEYEKMVNSYLEKIKKYIDSIKDDELIDKMVNAHKRAFSDNVTIPKQITLADCYKYCGTDENKPSYTGIYHDPKGFAVVTNGLILYAHNNLYESKSKGNIIDKSGKVINVNFPDWQAVVNRYANNTKILTPIDIDRDDFYRKLCMYERKFKYRRHHIPVQPFAIRYGDNEYLWSAELLKGLVHMSYAHKDVKFYLSVIKYESLRDDVFLVAKSSDGSVGMVGYGVGGFDGWYLDETNKYGLIQDKFTVGEPFLLDSVYQYAQGKQDGKKSNNLQLAKAKMKMAAARIKLMKM